MIKQIVLDAINLLHSSNKFRYVGKDWGQLDMDKPPVSFPCVLINLPGFEDAEETKGANKRSYTISVEYADIQQTVSSQYDNIGKSLDYMDRMDEIIAIMDKGDYKFVRAYDNPERDNITDYIMVFKKVVRTPL